VPPDCNSDCNFTHQRVPGPKWKRANFLTPALGEFAGDLTLGVAGRAAMAVTASPITAVVENMNLHRGPVILKLYAYRKRYSQL